MFPPQRNFQTSSRFDRGSLRWCALVGLFLSGFQVAPSQNSSAPQQVPQLEINRPIERELSGSQIHPYQIALTEGQFANVVVEQRGIDLTAQLVGVDGKPIAEFDNEITNQGQEKIELVAETSGNYQLVLKPNYPKLPAGRYEIRLLEVRNATEKDRLLQQARKLGSEAIQLRVDGKHDAISKAEQSLRMRQQVLGADHLEVADSLNALARTSRYLSVEGEIKREELLRRALSIREKVLGPDHPLTARILFDLATIHIRKRDFAEARQLLQRVLAVWEAKLGAGHPWVADALVDMASTYSRKGEHLAAEELLQRGLEIARNSLGYDDPTTRNILGTLLSRYRERRDYEKAERLSLLALDELEKELGAYDSHLITYLFDLGGTYMHAGNYVKAELTLQRALQISEKANLMNEAKAAITFQRLARIYDLKGDSTKAGQMLERALTIWQNLLGGDHPDVIANLSNLVKTYAGAGKVDQVIKFQSRENEITERMISRNLFESERQKLSYLSARSEQGDRSISLHLHLAPQNVAARELAITYILQRKGRVQDAVADNLAALRRRFSAEDRTLLDQMNDTTSQLAKLVLGGPKKTTPLEHQQEINVLEKQREVLESEISRRSDGFYQKSRPVTLADVQSAIPNNAALIEFVLYRPFDPKANRKESYGDPRYAAYVIRRDGEVGWKELGDAKGIDEAIDAWRRALRDPLRKDVQQLGRAVDEKLLRPIRALVGDATHLLFSPDGQLNLIPFHALVDEEGRYLLERYSLAYLTSGRDLLRLQLARQSQSPPVVVADPVFGDPPLVTENASAHGSSRARIDYSQIFFGPLPGVGDEVRSLRTLLPNASFLTKGQATRDALKRVAAPRILHIATHGFFLPDKSSMKADNASAAKTDTRVGKFALYTDNPLLRSGLALTGANLPSTTDDNGILTALEASGLNLWGTKLVVLSACDTGTGEIRNGEGVYGLRRALVLAGAESQLMSLWQVSDRSTRDLMVGYYNGLVQGRGRGEALRQVQLQMLQSKSHRHPYYWASFIQIGEWGNLEGKR